MLSLANVTFCFAIPDARLTSMCGAPPWRIEKIDAYAGAVGPAGTGATAYEVPPRAMNSASNAIGFVLRCLSMLL